MTGSLDANDFGCLIDGQIRLGARSGEVIDPATECSIGSYAIADEAMVEEAVASAVKAARLWRSATVSARQSVLHVIEAALLANRDELARLHTSEQGMPLRESYGEVDSCIHVMRHHAERLEQGGDPLAPAISDTFIQTHSPLGVVVAILPWNAPLLTAVIKIAYSVAAGNAIIVKPAPTTPATTMMLGRLVAADLPAGLVQILGDDGDVGPQLTAHPAVAKIVFTGSTITGGKVISSGSRTIKRVTAELGGNDPAIVLADAELASAAEGIFKQAFINAGQICSAVKRVYAHADIIDRLADRIAAMVRDTRVGNGFADDTQIGPLQNRAHFEKSRSLYDRTTSVGRVLGHSNIPQGSGYFLPVMLVTDIPPDHDLLTQEQFCPLLPLVPFTSTEDAIKWANDTPYGLTASIWSSDPAAAAATAMEIDAGLVCINAHRRNLTGQSVPLCKQSGIGWLGGDRAILEYVQPHLIAR